MSNPDNRPAPKRILVYGDSNTWGWIGVDHAFPSTRYRDDERWAGVMANALGDNYQISVDGLTARSTNLDDSTDWNSVHAQMLNGARLLPQAIAREMPLDLVILALGTNDLKAEFERDVEHIAEAIMSLVALVNASDYGIAYEYLAPKVLIVTPALIGDIPNEDFRAAFSGAAEKSRALPDAIKQAVSADNIAVVDSAEIVGVSAAVDGLHLDLQQHKILGNYIATTVKDMFA
ncbi:GDSL-type esterase/lipase family protein [Pseudoteredinibacter isoporae]|uniref:GDSL-type esterase/lipase family protein n=1 Tax=Pseudoteredinibacter isoporae TaxID=570281 RepID=UPI00310C820B